jgi:hypothetical protein
VKVFIVVNPNWGSCPGTDTIGGVFKTKESMLKAWPKIKLHEEDQDVKPGEEPVEHDVDTTEEPHYDTFEVKE